MPPTSFTRLRKLRYLNARRLIKPGDLLFCSGNYWISRLIRIFSKSKFSHVAFVFTWNNRILVFESVESDGVRITPLSNYLYNFENTKTKYRGKVFIGRYNKQLTSSQINKMNTYAVDLLNRRYDLLELFKIAFRYMTCKARHEDDDSYTCSEFVDVCFKQVNIHFPHDHKGFIYPEHVAQDKRVVPQFELVP